MDRPDLQYSLLALDFMSEPALQALLSGLACNLAAGKIKPMRTTVHHIRSVATAFRQIAQVGEMKSAMEFKLATNI